MSIFRISRPRIVSKFLRISIENIIGSLLAVIRAGTERSELFGLGSIISIYRTSFLCYEANSRYHANIVLLSKQNGIKCCDYDGRDSLQDKLCLFNKKRRVACFRRSVLIDSFYNISFPSKSAWHHLISPIIFNFGPQWKIKGIRRFERNDITYIFWTYLSQIITNKAGDVSNL